MTKDVSILFVDGERYAVAPDRARIVGRDRDYKTDEFRDAVGKKIPIVAAPPGPIGEGTVFAFSSEETFQKWLAENKLDPRSQGRPAPKPRRPLTGQELESVKRQQVAEVEAATRKYHDLLKKHGLKSEDVDKLEEILEREYDPYLGGRSHSAYLYDQTYWRGNSAVLPGDWWWCRRYPDLRWVGFDNRTKSLATWGSREVHLFEHPNFEGRRLWAWCALSDVSFVAFNSFGFDIASSAEVF